jgi:hypothetical protein
MDIASSTLNSWDVLAGILLVREAGGWVSDFLTGDGLVPQQPDPCLHASARGRAEHIDGDLAKHLRHIAAEDGARAQNQEQRHDIANCSKGACSGELVAENELVDSDRDRLPFRGIEQHGGADLADQRGEDEDCTRD